MDMSKIKAAIEAARAKQRVQQQQQQQQQPPLAVAVHRVYSDPLVQTAPGTSAAMHQPMPADDGLWPLIRTELAAQEIATHEPETNTPAAAPTEHEQLVTRLAQHDIILHDDDTFTIKGRHYNEQQSQAIWAVAIREESICLIGAAGTGKTTNIQGVTYVMEALGMKPLDRDTKCLQAGSPGAVVASFTRRAVANIKRYMPDTLRANTLTIHKLLEYSPVIYEEYDPEQKKVVKKRRFEPKRNKYNPLPTGIRVIFIEETSMLGLDLFSKLWDALPFPEKIQWVFLGDLNQLPPVFGHSIFGFKLLELRVIELVEVYRQALESPGLRLAHLIKNGGTVPSQVVKGRFQAPAEWNHPGKLSIRYWQHNVDPNIRKPDLALLTAAKFFTTGIEQGYYNPEEDMILIPQNVKFGSIELGKYISQYLGTQRNVPVHEIIAGFQKHYLAVGDKILYDKEDAIIEEIIPNPMYLGALPQEASTKLDRWGVLNDKQAEHHASFDEDALDSLLATADDSEDRVHAASHKIKVRYVGISARDEDDSDEDSYEWLDKATQINNILNGYVMTIHKSQGCEWKRVFVLIHGSHNGMVSREILYTAITRFREQLIMIVEPDIGKPGTKGFKAGTLSRGAEYQEIPGNNLQEKLLYFREKQLEALQKLQKTEDQEEQQLLLTMIGSKIREHIASQVKEWEPRIQEAVAETWRKLQAAHPTMKIPDYKIQITTTFGNVAGLAEARPGTSIISLDSMYFLANPEEGLARTVPHEVAHIADACWFEGIGHGRTWKQLMQELGFVPDKEIYHELGSRSQGMKKLAAGMN